MMQKREGLRLAKALRRSGAKPQRLQDEKRIEQDLKEKSQKLLRRIRPGLALWRNDERLGQQLVCPEAGGRIDLLFTTPGDRTFVVVELKVVPATAATFGQVSSYVGWVRQHLAKGRRVVGVVVAKSATAAFDACLKSNRDISFISLEALGY